MLDLNRLLEIVHEIANDRKQLLTSLEEKWGGKPYGIHEWFRIELMAKLWQKGWEVKSYSEGRGRPIGPDLIIGNKLVELRPLLNYNVKWISDGFNKKPRPDYVLFLALSSENFLKRLNELEQQGFNVRIRRVESSNWAIGVLSEALQSNIPVS